MSSKKTLDKTTETEIICHPPLGYAYFLACQEAVCVSVLLCFIKPILGNCYVRSRGFIVSEPRETHPQSEIVSHKCCLSTNKCCLVHLLGWVFKTKERKKEMSWEMAREDFADFWATDTHKA
jgi:hypothetical protein